jgi:hypothetical protein
MIKLYSRLRLGWKLFIWEAGILFAIVVTGLLNPKTFLNGWALEDTLIFFFLSFIVWWGIVFVILWIIDGFRNG